MRPKSRVKGCAFGWLAALLIGVPAAAQTSDPPPDRTLRPLRGSVYQATEGGRTRLLFVSGEGILLIDPLNVEFAQWLKDELDQRFPGQPVRYVVYTSLDFDRAGGGTHYNTTAEISPLAGFRVFRSGTFDVSVLGGPTFANMKAAITLRSSPTAAPQQSAIKVVVRGYTFGADFAVPLGARLQLAIPVRVTTLPAASEVDPLRTTTNVRAGLGLNVALSQRVY